MPVPPSYGTLVCSPRVHAFTRSSDIFRTMVRKFFEDEVVPFHEQWEKDGEVSRELWRKAGANGLLGTTYVGAHGRRHSAPPTVVSKPACVCVCVCGYTRIRNETPLYLYRRIPSHSLVSSGRHTLTHSFTAHVLADRPLHLSHPRTRPHS